MDVVRLYFGNIDGFLGPGAPFNGYAVKHPKGIVLIDTGFGEVFGLGRRGEVQSKYGALPWTRRHTIEALADHNIDPADVKYIVNTHLGDHSGDNRDFKDATFFIQQAEIESARTRWPADSPNNVCWNFLGAKIEALAGEDLEILPGITALFTPGHTPGHQSVLVEANGLKQLFVGDAVYTVAIFTGKESMTEDHATWQAQGAGAHWFESMDKLKKINADVVHFSHDPDILRLRRSTPPRSS